VTERPTALPGLRLFELSRFSDARGRFFETYRLDRYAAAGIDAAFVQTNVSVSGRGVLRGLHAQNPTPQGKLVTVLGGAAWDVAVDVREGSPTFGVWESFELTGDNGLQLWVPPGYLHGFLSLAPETIFSYAVTAPYDPSGEFGVAWDDPDLAVAWPLAGIGTPDLSPKDAQAPRLSATDPARFRLPSV
jgi:dTDP-4-dehydrorhamnose 3,5-epimerase